MAQTKGEGAGVGDFATGSLIEKHNIIEILDEIEKMGYIDLYKAYKEDLNTSE